MVITIGSFYEIAMTIRRKKTKKALVDPTIQPMSYPRSPLSESKVLVAIHRARVVVEASMDPVSSTMDLGEAVLHRHHMGCDTFATEGGGMSLRNH